MASTVLRRGFHREMGLLSDDTEMEWVDEKEAQKLWEWLFENREQLLFYQENLLTLIEKLKH